MAGEYGIITDHPDILGGNKPAGAVKYDSGKAPIVQGVLARFPRAIEAVAYVSQLGCNKYGLPSDDRGFMDVENGFGRYTDALGRHLLGETTDGPWNIETGGKLPEKGMLILHAAQVAWDSFARLEILLRDHPELREPPRLAP